jgi:hypothetical protein
METIWKIYCNACSHVDALKLHLLPHSATGIRDPCFHYIPKNVTQDKCKDVITYVYDSEIMR